MNKFRLFFAICLEVTALAALLIPITPTALAGIYDCSAHITFDVNPKQITDTQAATISGSITLTVPDGNSCTIPGTNSRMSQLILSVFDQTSSQELFYVNGFTFHPGTSTQYSWSIDPRQIGAAQLKQSQLTSAKSLSVVGIVKISNDGSNWYQLTASSPVPVQVNVTNQQTSQQQTTSQNNSATTLYNPVSGVNSLTDLLLQIMKGFLAIVAVWAVAFIVIGGFRMVITQGNEEAIGAAKKTITWAILGLVVALLSFSIIAIVQNLIGVDIQPVSTSLIKTINKPL